MPIYYHYAIVMNNNIVVLFKPLTGLAVNLKHNASINREVFCEIKEDT